MDFCICDPKYSAWGSLESDSHTIKFKKTGMMSGRGWMPVLQKSALIVPTLLFSNECVWFIDVHSCAAMIGCTVREFTVDLIDHGLRKYSIEFETMYKNEAINMALMMQPITPHYFENPSSPIYIITP